MMDCDVKIMVRNGGAFCLGPGVVSLLEEIGKAGSVSQAAGNMKISYSKAWRIIADAEEGCGYSLVTRAKGGASGGSAALTPEAEKNIAAFRQLESEVGDFAQKAVKRLFS